jgi:acetylornithine deacetylase/succinyl-diaminopimelate desuccinylase-like protein
VETQELLQQLIRNQCVNTGEASSAHESRSADVLASLFDTSTQIEKHAEITGRDNLVVRIEGSNPNAPTLALLPHMDVVPVNEKEWEHDPFGGELISGFIWGRGAVDMLNLTSTMALAVRDFIASGKKPKGTIIYIAVADEEAGGVHGAKYLLDNYAELVSADYVLTETGGIQMPVGDTTFLPVVTREKGVHWMTISIDGTARHGSIPFGARNAVADAAEIIHRLNNYKPPLTLIDGWEQFLTALGVNDEETHDDALESLDPKLAGVIHAGCHHTLTPTVIHGGTKVNMVPDQCEVKVDIRTLPGTTIADVTKMIKDALGEYYDRVEITFDQNVESTSSPTSGAMWDLLNNVSQSLIEKSELLPVTATYGTDARYYRERGASAYGAGLFSPVLSYEEHVGMFHGPNEKIDVESLELTHQFYSRILEKFADL